MYRPRYNLKTCVTCLCLENCLRKLFTSSTVLTKNHYDSLGITPRATQAQVKSAYYKLSKIHHPDRNDGSEASSQKFREVSAAYEILGNVKLRKMYDKGWCVFLVAFKRLKIILFRRFNRHHKTHLQRTSRSEILSF